MMKPGILTQIMITPANRRNTTREAAQRAAQGLGFTMFAFNGCVYATGNGSEFIKLFLLSDLVDYNYSPLL